MERVVKVILGLLIFISVYSCKKEKLEHYYVSDAFKRWTVFNKNSYWMFLNDSTQVTDSVYIKENPKFLEVKPNNSNMNFTEEWIEMSYSSVFFSSSEQNVRQGGTELYSITIHGNTFYALIASSSDNFGPDYDSFKLLSRDSVYYLGPAKFYNVVKSQDIAYGKTWTCWFARDIGLIKITGKNTNPDFSWSLLRYHIVK